MPEELTPKDYVEETPAERTSEEVSIPVTEGTADKVRRLTLFLEESISRSIQWAVFEPNDGALWARIRQQVGDFLDSLFRQGAFQGQSPDKAYFVKCGRDTTTQNEIDQGLVNLVVGFAPLKPAEFFIFRLQQRTSQIRP